MAARYTPPRPPHRLRPERAQRFRSDRARATRRGRSSRRHLRRARVPRRRSLFWPMLASAIFGAVLALAALAVIWRYNVLEPYNIDVGGKLASARLAALEARVRATAGFRVSSALAAVARAVSQCPRPPADTKALDELTARLAKLETAVAKSAAGPSDPALANPARRARERAQAAGRCGRRKSSATKTSPLGCATCARARCAAKSPRRLDRRAAPGSRRRAKPTSTSSTRAWSRLKLPPSRCHQRTAAGAADKSRTNPAHRHSGIALRSAVERGVPYATELAALKAQVARPAGARAARAVRRDRRAEPGGARAGTRRPDAGDHARGRAGRQPAEGNFTQRLQARAREFVQIRPVGDAAGDDPRRSWRALPLRRAAGHRGCGRRSRQAAGGGQGDGRGL